MGLVLPHSFGRYRLTRLIGEGGMAEVYQASVGVAEGLEKKVVIKKIRREFADQHEFTRMFVDEAKIALSLNHANIVQVFDFGQVRGDLYLAMEMIEGVDLMRLLHAVRQAEHRVPAVIAAYVGHQAAAGLAYAHRKADDYGRPLGIVHRDVSPHNVMVSYEGQVKILDFGISRTRSSVPQPRPDDTADPEETIKGKIAYMSPEQARGRPVDMRSDVYSLGICLHEVLTGTLLFRERNRNKALELVRTTPVPPLRKLAPDTPEPLVEIVERALARDPGERFESARAMQAELAEFLHRSDPVVDDEVLASFVGHYVRPHAPAGSVPRLVKPEPSRELDTDHTDHPIRASREAQRVVVVWVAIERTASRAAAEPAGDTGSSESGALGRVEAHSPDAEAFLSLARDVAFKREAQVLRASPDALVLAFGALLRTGGDAERALRSALALREDAGEAAAGLRLGFLVANTPAIVQRDGQGSVKVDVRPVIGRQLDAAARAHLDGAVLVSGNLVDTLSGAWRFGHTVFVEPPTDATGSAAVADRELEHVAPLLGPATREQRRALGPPGGRALLVGRELELKTLRDAFSDAIRSRRSRAVLITGEPGLGKRALVERFVASLPRTAAWVLRATGSWSRRNLPMGVFVDLLSRFLEIEHQTPSAQIVARLERLGVRQAELLGQTLATSLGVADAEPPAVSPRTRRERLWRLVRRIIVALAQRRPVLVIVENLQFHDEPSLDVLRAWMSSTQPWPVLGVTTGRPGTRRVDLVRQSGVTEIQLAELDPKARRELVSRRFEDPSRAEPLIEAILARTGGNPLFIEQLLASLIERGAVAWNTRGQKLVVRQPGAAVRLPATIEAALGERIEELSPDDREVLIGAAVLGRNFRAGELPALLERDVEDALAHLLQRGFVERIEGARAGAQTHRFATVSLHETCKASMSPPIAKRLHTRAAALRRERDDYSPERDAGPIADHWMAAGQPEHAIEPALRAATGAFEVAGNAEAYYYLSLALSALPPHDVRRFDVLLRREGILRVWGQRRAQVADIRSLLHEAQRQADPKLLATGSTRLLRFYLEIGRPQSAERLLPRVEQRVAAVNGATVLTAVLDELRSELAFLQGRFDDARRYARAGLPHCGHDDEGLRQRAHLLRALGQVEAGVGRFEAAHEAYEEALTLARRIDDTRLEANLLNALGEVAGRSTRYQEAIDYFKASLALDRQLGDRFATGRKLANLGTAYAVIGLNGRAERYLHKAIELHKAVEHPGEEGDVVVTLGEVVAARGDLDVAQSLLRDAIESARERGDLRTELRARVRLAAVLLDRGRPPDLELAQGLAQQVLQQASSARLRTARRRALAVLARLDAHHGDTARAIARQRDALALVRDGADPIDGVRSIHHLGRLLVDGGDTEEGTALLREAAAMVQARLDDLRDEVLRRGYLEQLDVRRILVDGGTSAPTDAEAMPESAPSEDPED